MLQKESKLCLNNAVAIWIITQITGLGSHSSSTGFKESDLHQGMIWSSPSLPLTINSMLYGSPNCHCASSNGTDLFSPPKVEQHLLHLQALPHKAISPSLLMLSAALIHLPLFQMFTSLLWGSFFVLFSFFSRWRCWPFASYLDFHCCVLAH